MELPAQIEAILAGYLRVQTAVIVSVDRHHLYPLPRMRPKKAVILSSGYARHGIGRIPEIHKHIIAFQLIKRKLTRRTGKLLDTGLCDRVAVHAP